jgi:hypothetical protein
LSEREALYGFLDLQRAALLRKTDGISDSDARKTPTVSSLSLLGLLKHSALWERPWFQVVFVGRTLPGEWPESNRKAWRTDDFMVDDNDTIDHWVAYYQDQVAISREIAASAELDAPCARQDLAPRNLRWVLLHLIEETAPHAGHADIIRETLDGIRGI